MKITQVVVSIHEKRNHPYAYGHYDASVTLTAEVGKEAFGDLVRDLRTAARLQVLEECDGWEKGVHRTKRIEDLKIQIASGIREVGWSRSRAALDKQVQEVVERINELPEHMRGYWVDRLGEATERCAERIDMEQDEVEERVLDPDSEITF